MFSAIKDKVIILTGASGLIGTETQKHLEKNEAIVISVDIHYEHSPQNGHYKYDITQKQDIDILIKEVVGNHKRIDGLVNLAYPRTKDWGTSFEDIPLKSWQENVDMQLNSLFYICQQVLKIMKKQRKGSIVNIASIYGVVGNDFTLYEEYGGTSPAAYSAIKGGIINFSRYLASYYGKYNIRINCVSPGGILDEKNQHPSFIKKYSEKSLLKRLGNPEEIAPAITFLLSDEASFITGHNLMVDGGWTAI
ncbi:MAG: SDR family oxidoreductase [Petrimonas sp.]|uniref:SDR family oxidoreductase n=1 Tax=Petrimonas sp. TaxID=2023866 RepID=UPI002B38A13B|nr:SDR family oxidoreductase [Petrimonas sp.]MEA5045649.1 SDR family oxidoreductase [Petrimonas sp.]